MSHSSIMVAQTIGCLGVTVTEKYRFQSVLVCYTSVDSLPSLGTLVNSPNARTRFALYETLEACVLVVIIVIALSVESLLRVAAVPLVPVMWVMLRG